MKRRTWRDLALVVFGSFMFSAGVNTFIISAQLGEGGVTGLSIVFYYAFHISPAITNFLIVVAISFTVIPVNKLLVTIISLYIGTKVMEFVIEGLNTKKAMTVISSRPDEVAKVIDQKIGRGVTIIDGRGYYSKEDKEILYVVISKTQVSKAKRLIRKIDENAFLVIHDVRDVYGNGFLVDE